MKVRDKLLSHSEMVAFASVPCAKLHGRQAQPAVL